MLAANAFLFHVNYAFHAQTAVSATAIKYYQKGQKF